MASPTAHPSQSPSLPVCPIHRLTFTSTLPVPACRDQLSLSSSTMTSSASPPASSSATLSQPSVRLSSGHSMPLIGFGTWGGGDDAATISNAVQHALTSGYLHIDCAQYYRNEAEIGSVIGPYLQANPQARPSLFITSKGPPPSLTPLPPLPHHSPPPPPPHSPTPFTAVPPLCVVSVEHEPSP